MGTLNQKPPALRRQQGLALMMTLITLVIITISVLAMMMVIRGGVTASGNIAFRQAATRVSDEAVEAVNADVTRTGARDWLLKQTAVYLQSDHASEGYYAANDPVFAPQSYDFYDFVTRLPKNARYVGNFSGYDIYYVIHRMAMTSGTACTDPAAGCLFPPVAGTAGTSAGQSYGAGSSYAKAITGTAGLAFYRVTIKVAGPRFNNRYVQAFLY